MHATGVKVEEIHVFLLLVTVAVMFHDMFTIPRERVVHEWH